MNDEHGDCDAWAFTHRDYLVLHIETTLFSHGTNMQVAYLTDFCILLIMCVLACGQLWCMLAYCRLDVMKLVLFRTAAHYQYCKHVVGTTVGSVPLESSVGLQTWQVLMWRKWFVGIVPHSIYIKCFYVLRACHLQLLYYLGQCHCYFLLPGVFCTWPLSPGPTNQVVSWIDFSGQDRSIAYQGVSRIDLSG